jgi:hypothetical protein
MRDRVHAVIWSEEKHHYASEWLKRQDRSVGADPLVLVFMAISAAAAIAGAVVAVIWSLRQPQPGGRPAERDAPPLNYDLSAPHGLCVEA